VLEKVPLANPWPLDALKKVATFTLKKVAPFTLKKVTKSSHLEKGETSFTCCSNLEKGCCFWQFSAKATTHGDAYTNRYMFMKRIHLMNMYYLFQNIMFLFQGNGW
jgi:hypothetical protein